MRSLSNAPRCWRPLSFTLGCTARGGALPPPPKIKRNALLPSSRCENTGHSQPPSLRRSARRRRVFQARFVSPWHRSVGFHESQSLVCRRRSQVAGLQVARPDRARLAWSGSKRLRFNHGYRVTSCAQASSHPLRRAVMLRCSFFCSPIRWARQVRFCGTARSTQAACLPATLSPNQVLCAMANFNS